MNTETYQAAVIQVHLAAQLLARHDLPGLIEAINWSESIGPLVDPTLWIQKHQAMREDKEALEAAMSLWRLGQKWKQRHAAEQE